MIVFLKRKLSLRRAGGQNTRGRPGLSKDEEEMCAEDKHYKDWHGDAVEHFEFNVIGAYYGDHTPVFLYRDMEEV